MNLDRLKKKISRYDVISFDIFDTLINRCVGNPHAVFDLMERKLCTEFGDKYKGFCQKRLQAESEAIRKSRYEEVTIDEIYECLDVVHKNGILELEKIIEIEITEPNEEMYKLYQECIRQGKRIIICSDMYLGQETIEAILRKNGYGKYEKLYLSSDIKAKKSNGTLYGMVARDLFIEAERIIHIGDNLKSDFIQARKNGFSAYHYPRYRKYRDDMEYPYNIFYGNMPENFSKKFYWEQVGKYSLGNFLYGYMMWLKDCVEKEVYDHIFFLSRDGFIMQKAMGVIASQKLADKCSYLYVSRRSLIVPTLHLYQGYKKRCTIMFWKKHFTIKDFVENFGLDYDVYKQQIDLIAKDHSKVYERSEMFSDKELLNVYKQLEKEIEVNSKHEYELLVKYLRQSEFAGKVAIVDTGWFGNLQNAIEIVTKASEINVQIHGYYIGVRNKCIYFDKQRMSGYLYFGQNHMQNQRNEIYANAIVEAFHSHDEGSVKCYRDMNGIIEPVLKENDLSEMQCKTLNIIQRAALKRIRYLTGIKSLKINDLKPEIYFNGFYRIGIKPTQFDSWKLGRFVENNQIHGLTYYFFHPTRLKKDIYELNWKLGQLKRVIKIKLDYLKLYDFLDG